jgi:energy-converting hydrogenase Eha subunit C
VFATSLGPFVGFCLSVNPLLRVVYFSHAQTGHIVLSDLQRLLLVAAAAVLCCVCQLELELDDLP